MQEHLPAYSKPKSKSSDRVFGLVFAGIFFLVSVYPLFFGHTIRVWLILIAFVFLLSAFLMPALLTPLNDLWTKFGLILHLVIGPITLGAVFFLVISPMAIFLRLIGKDPLRLMMDSSSDTYWIIRMPSGPDAKSFKNQF